MYAIRSYYATRIADEEQRAGTMLGVAREVRLDPHGDAVAESGLTCSSLLAAIAGRIAPA